MQRKPAEDLTIEEAYCDFSALNDSELDDYITRLAMTRCAWNFMPDDAMVLKYVEYASLLSLVIAEKNSRKTSRLTKVTIAVAASSVLVGAANLIPVIAGLFQ